MLRSDIRRIEREREEEEKFSETSQRQLIIFQRWDEGELLNSSNGTRKKKYIKNKIL